MWKYHNPRTQIGALRERVKFQSASDAPDDARQPIRTWADTSHTNIPASKENVAGGEFIRGRQIDASTTAIFLIRNLSGLTPQLRLVHIQESKTYNIVRIDPADDRGQFLMIQCKREANNG